MESCCLTAMDRVIAFLNLFDGDCKSCLRKSSYSCSNCRASTAKSILAQIKAEQKQKDANQQQFVPDYSLYARMAIILMKLKTAGRPLRFGEINLTSCSPQLKLWTLMRMIRMGTIERRREGRNYLYSLTTKIKKGRVK